MAEEPEQIPRIAEAPLPEDAPPLIGGSADATVAAADPFASTLTAAAASSAPASSQLLQGPQLEPGRELGPVRLIREIGRGATGAVFHGHHTVLGRDVAVKFLIHVASAGAADGEGLKRFVDEARAAASVRHPNLTQIFHADVDGGTPYLVLEYVQGPTLRQLLEHAGTLTVSVAAAALGDVAAAVAELHARGIIHRDIKPSNALVDQEGRVFVTDFGLAVRRSHSPAVGGASADIDFAGTPSYMAPEMFEGRVSARSDVYAMGIMAFQLLTGVTPFSGAFHELRDKHAHEPLPSQMMRERGVGPAVVEVIERATNKQAMFRYKTAPDLARALREAAGLGATELARARKQLCDLVAGRAASAAESGSGPGVTEAGEIRGRRLASGDDADSTLYTQTISRIATIKRERRRNPGDSEGSSVMSIGANAKTVAESAPLAPAQPTPAEAPSVPSASNSPPPVSSQSPGVDRSRLVPGPVLLVSLAGIVYGSLMALWTVGVVSGRGNLGPPVPPAAGQTLPAVIVLVLAAVVYFFLAALLVPISFACLALRPLARRLMLLYAMTDLALQFVVLLLAVLWIEPARAAALAARTASVHVADMSPWLFQWLVLSLFPAVALYVMSRRNVRSAFEVSDVVREPNADSPQPMF